MVARDRWIIVRSVATCALVVAMLFGAAAKFVSGHTGGLLLSPANPAWFALSNAGTVHIGQL